jgi:Icc-related predicted phosphoesterase
VIVVAGDITWAESDLKDIIGPLKKYGKPVIMIPGNHETLASVDFLEKLYQPGVYNLHARGIKINDTCFVACGSGNIGLFQLSESEVTDALEKAIKEVKGCTKTVLVTHTPLQHSTRYLAGQTPGARPLGSQREAQPDLSYAATSTDRTNGADRHTIVMNVGFIDMILIC